MKEYPLASFLNDNVDFCRVCLASKTKLHLLYNKKLVKSFSELCKINNKGLDSKIALCYKCMSQFNKVVQFQKTCINTNQIIKKYIKNEKKLSHSKENSQSIEYKVAWDLSSSRVFSIDVCCHRIPSSSCVKYYNEDVSEINYKTSSDIDVGYDIKQESEQLSIKNNKHFELPSQEESYENASLKNYSCQSSFSNDVFDANEDHDLKNLEVKKFENYSQFHPLKTGLFKSDDDGSVGAYEDILSPPNSEKNISKKSKCKFEKNHSMKCGDLSKCNFVCSCCHESFASSNKLKKHGSVHSQLKAFICQQCGKSFKHKYLLVTHLASHRDVRDFVCDQCGKPFTSKTTLVNHKLIHSNTKKFECDYCGKKYLRKFGLEIHIRTHTGAKNYICDFCGKAFAVSRNLVVHKRIHSGTKPYSCQICHKRFTESGTVKSHMRFHTGEKPFHCKFCDSTFRTSSEMHMHQAIHSDLRPYSCDLCSSTFRRAYHLKRHKLRHGKSS